MKPRLTYSLLAPMLFPQSLRAPRAMGTAGERLVAALAPRSLPRGDFWSWQGMLHSAPWPCCFLTGTFECNRILFLISLALMNLSNLMNVSLPQHSGFDQDFFSLFAWQLLAPCQPVLEDAGQGCHSSAERSRAQRSLQNQDRCIFSFCFQHVSASLL